MHPHLAIRKLKDFWLNDFSRRYIQFVRDRLSANDKEAQFVVKEVYLTIVKLLAPVCPFIVEDVWQNLRKKGIVKEESVHLCSWPKEDMKKIDGLLEKRMENVLKIIEIGLAERDKVKIGLKWPLAKAVIYSKEKQSLKEFEGIIRSQLNIKKFELKVNPKASELSVELDTEMTEELESEGYARELSRQTQDFRKKLGLQKQNSIELFIITDKEFGKTLEKQKDFIKERTNSKKIEIINDDKGDIKETFKNKTNFSIKDKSGEIAVIVTDG